MYIPRQFEFDFTEAEFLSHLANPEAFPSAAIAKDIQTQYHALLEEEDRRIAVTLYARMRIDNNSIHKREIHTLSHQESVSTSTPWKVSTGYVDEAHYVWPVMKMLNVLITVHELVGIAGLPLKSAQIHTAPEYYLLFLNVLHISRQCTADFASNPNRLKAYPGLAERATIQGWTFTNNGAASDVRFALSRWLNRGFDLNYEWVGRPPRFRKEESLRYNEQLVNRFIQTLNADDDKLRITLQHEIAAAMQLSDGERAFAVVLMSTAWPLDAEPKMTAFRWHAMQCDQSYLVVALMAAAEAHYYDVPRSETAVPRQSSFSTILPALRLRFPSTLMMRHPRGTRLQLDGRGENGRDYNEFIHVEVAQTLSSDNVKRFENDLNTLYDKVQEDLGKHTLEDSNTWEHLDKWIYNRLYRLIILYRWSLRFLSNRGTSNAPWGDVTYPQVNSLMTRLEKLPDTKLLALARQSGYVFDWTRVNMTRVRYFLNYGYLRWCMDVVEGDSEGVLALLCTVGFERLRRDQFALLMAIRGLIRTRAVVLVAAPRGPEYSAWNPSDLVKEIQIEQGTRLNRFMRIFSRLSEGMAESVASTLTGQEVIAYDLNRLAWTFTDDTLDFIKGSPSYRNIIRETVDNDS